jgi:hypothetical protein
LTATNSNFSGTFLQAIDFPSKLHLAETEQTMYIRRIRCAIPGAMG